jgi:hypothetical protein
MARTREDYGEIIAPPPYLSHEDEKDQFQADARSAGWYQTNDSTPPSVDPQARKDFDDFVAQKSSRDFWEGGGSVINHILNQGPLGAARQAAPKIMEGIDASREVTEAGLGTLQAASLLGKHQDQAAGRSDFSVSQFGRGGHDSTRPVKMSDDELNRLNSFLHGVGDISQKTGQRPDDWRVIANAAQRMRGENPSVPDAIANAALDPINLPFAAIGPGAKTISETGRKVVGAIADARYGAGLSDENLRLSDALYQRRLDMQGKKAADKEVSRLAELGETADQLDRDGASFWEKFKNDERGFALGPGDEDPEKILEAMRKSDNLRTRAQAKIIDSLVASGKTIEQAVEESQKMAKKLGSVESAPPTTTYRDDIIVQNMVNKGSRAEVQGLSVVSTGSKSPIERNPYPTVEAAEKRRDEINAKIDAALAGGAQTKAKKPAPGPTRKEDIEAQLKIVRQKMAAQDLPPAERAEVEKVLNRAEKDLQVEMERPYFEQTTMFDPKAYDDVGRFTKPGDNFPTEEVDHTGTLPWRQEDIPGDLSGAGGAFDLPGTGEGSWMNRTGGKPRPPMAAWPGGDGPSIIESVINQGVKQVDGAGGHRQQQLFPEGPGVEFPETSGDPLEFDQLFKTSDTQETMVPRSIEELAAAQPSMGDAMQSAMDAGGRGSGSRGGGGGLPIGGLTPGGAVNFALKAPREIMASLDISATLRQGGIAAVAHNPEWRKAVQAEIKALRGEKQLQQVKRELEQLSTYDMGQALGLKSGIGKNSRSARFEAFDDVINSDVLLVGGAVRASDRAYEAFLATARANIFETYAKKFGLINDEMLAMAGPSFNKTTLHATGGNGDQLISLLSPKKQQEAKQLADFINTMTGRGNLGKMESWSPGLNALFFSPRFFASRINNIFAPLVYTGQAMAGQGSWNVAKLAWRDMSMFWGTNLTLMTLASQAGVKVEWDPRSTRFGTMSFGDHHVDISGGMNRTFGEFYQTFVVGSSIDSNGKETSYEAPAFGQDSFFSELTNFARQKLNKPVSALIDLKSGNRNVVGEPLGVTGHIPAPIIVTNILDAANEDYKRHGLPEAILTGAATALGESIGLGINTYQIGGKKGDLPGNPVDQFIYENTGIGKSPSPDGGRKSSGHGGI